MTKAPPPGNEKIRIVCRIRPFLEHEAEEKVVQVSNSNTIRLYNKRDPSSPLIYNNFSSCYSDVASQESIFVQDVRPLIEKVFEGYDATIFAYGVTGSGKTYTMQGSNNEPGIIPRVSEFLFETKEATQISTIDITMSYMEILKETVFDMLTPRDKSAALDIREDTNRQVFVANLTEKRVQTYKEFQRVFHAASKNRSTASTKLNSRSSRSHAILTLNVTIVTPVKTTNGLHEDTVKGSINLIDLAGSEDNRKSGNGKARMTESGAINKSLFVLGQVVEALNNGTTRVPFRDSKMTRILQSTLTGNALGMMIVNIAPGHEFFSDTVNTLNFAHRSKEIKSTPKANIRRTRSMTKALMASANTIQQAANVSRKTSNIYPTPAHDIASKEVKQFPLSASRQRRTSNTHLNKRGAETYEQRMRSSKKGRYSPSLGMHKNTITSPSSLGNGDQDQQMTMTATAMDNLQRWLKDIPFTSTSNDVTNSALLPPRAWSTITTNPDQQSTTNFMQRPKISVENAVTRMPRFLSRPTRDGEDLVVMTRTEFDNFRDQLVTQTKQELLSSMFQSE